MDYCNLLAQCCAASGVSSSGIAKSCTSSLTNVYLSSTTYTESIEGLGFGTVYSPSTGQACIQALQQASGQSSCATADSFGAACQNVFACSNLTGTKAAGETCACDAECMVPAGGKAICYGGAIAADGGVQSTGTCVSLTAAAQGQGPCLVTIHENGTTTNRWTGAGNLPSQASLCRTTDGVWCNAMTQQCTALETTGQSCTQDWDCVADDYCPSSTGTCTVRVADGAACAGTSNVCSVSSYCASSSKTCKPKAMATSGICLW
jgi:hypothetical protein